METEQSQPPSPLLNEPWISLAQAAKLLPPCRSGRPVSASCVWHWCRVGVKLANGQVVRLEAMKVVNRFVTSAEAVRRFVAAQQLEAAVPAAVEPTRPAQRSEGKRRRDSARALEQLNKLTGRGAESPSLFPEP